MRHLSPIAHGEPVTTDASTHHLQGIQHGLDKLRPIRSLYNKFHGWGQRSGGAMGTGATEPMGTAVVYSGCDRFVGAPYAAMAIALTLGEPLYGDGNRFKLQLLMDV